MIYLYLTLTGATMSHWMWRFAFVRQVTTNLPLYEWKEICLVSSKAPCLDQCLLLMFLFTFGIDWLKIGKMVVSKVLEEEL